MAAWKTCKLGEVADVATGNSNREDAVENGKYPLYDRSPEVKRSNRYLFDFPEGAVIVPGEGQAFVPRFARGKFDLHQRAYEVSPKLVEGKPPEADARYLYYFLMDNRDYFARVATGSTVKSLRQWMFHEMPLSLPSLSEQERIAGVLGAYDDLIAVNARRMALLVEAAHRLYRERFVTHADPAWPSRPLGEVAEGEHTNLAWRKCPLGELASVTMGQSPESCNYNVEQVGLPFHQGVGTFGAWFPQEEVYTSKYSREAYAGDILFSVRAPVGRINLADKHCAIGRGVAAIRSVSGRQAFLFQLLREAFVREDMIGNGAIFASVSKDDLLRLEVAVPPEHVEADLDKQLTPYFEMVGALARENALLREARDGLLPRLLREEA